MTSADLRMLAAFCKKQKQPLHAQIATWGADQVDSLTNWQTVAQTQLTQLQTADTQLAQQATANTAQIAQQTAAIASLNSQVVSLQANLAAATISPLSLVLVGTHLHGFATAAEASTFIQANSGQTVMELTATDFTWHPTT